MQRFAATGPDIFGYLLRDTADSTLRSVITFQGRLPISSLEKSVESILKNQWVLASSIESDGEGWVDWVHEPDINPADCISEHIVENTNPEPFLFYPIDDASAPQLHLNLLHTPTNDILVVSSPHSVLDGKGMKELTSMVLLGCAGQFIETGVNGYLSRSEQPIWDNLDEESLKMVSEDKEWPYCSWPSMYNNPQHQNGKVLIRHVKIEHLNDLRESLPGKVTIHDMLMASFYLALVEVLNGKNCGRISSTVDDRKYMPNNEVIPDIANISSNYSMNIPEDLHGFQNIVDFISKEHRRKKQEKMGLSNLLAFSKAKNIDEIKHWVDEMRNQATDGMAQYFLSNLGIFEIDKQVLDILGIEDVYFSYPGIKPPTVGITVSTFNGVMNLNTGYYPGVDLSKLERFLDTIVHYLSTGQPLVERNYHAE